MVILWTGGAYALKISSGNSKRYLGNLEPQTNWMTSSQNETEFRPRRSKQPDLESKDPWVWGGLEKLTYAGLMQTKLTDCLILVLY